MIGFIKNLAWLFFVMILFIAVFEIAADANGNNEKQVTMYGWQGMGNGGPYMTTVQTNNCRRTVRALLNENEPFVDYDINKATARRSIYCWSVNGELLWRSAARVIPTYEGESCLARSEWSGFYIVEHCEGRAKRSVVFSESLGGHILDD